MGSKKTVYAISLSVLLTAAVVIYTVVVPAIVSRQYTSRMDNAAQPLGSSFQSLDKSTELPLITDSGAPAGTTKKNMADIAQLIRTSRQKLASLKQANESLALLPFADIFGRYNDAQVLQDRTADLIGQSEDALNNYQTLTAYLETFDAAAASVSSQLNAFNGVSDLNIYTGQSEQMRQIANTIRADAATLSKATRLSDTGAMNDAAVTAFNEAASGFDDLANGLMIPADDPIYAAAHEIEDASGKIDTITSTTYDDTLNRSRTIKDIQDLSEKLELVSGTSGS